MKRLADLARSSSGVNTVRPEPLTPALLEAIAEFPGLAAAERSELESLRAEIDPILLGKGMLNLARRLQVKGQLDPALQLYQVLAEFAQDPKTQAEARASLGALQGSGGFGARFEFHLSRFSKDASDPRMILPMLAGSVVYGLARTATLGRLAAGAEASVWTRGLGARFASGMVGYAAEVPTFALAGRGVRWAAGDDPSREAGLGHDLAASAVTLGALKLSGFAGQSLLRRPAVQTLAPAFAKPLHFAVGQGSMFAGMLAAHKLEERLGLRPHVDGATTLTDIFASMVSLGAGAKLGRLALGKGLARFQQEMELRNQIRSQPKDVRGLLENPFLAPMWMAMGMGGIGGGGGRPPLRFKDTKGEPVKSARNFGSWPTLRSYQEKMLRTLGEDIQLETAPWLGLASPMQTGKSHLIGPIVSLVRQKFGPEARILVLSSARIITDQLLKDLIGQVPEAVGRFDAHHKDLDKKLTVASAFALVRHLDEFPAEGPVILINDEAYSTQAPTFRNIYSHFGMGEVQQQGGIPVLMPKQGEGLVIGLSGTGGGLDGYHISHQMNLTEAIELGAVRQMRGERIAVDLSSQEKENFAEGGMIWWQPTQENAEALAEIYAKHLHDSFKKNLVFVPTIEHGDLLLAAMQEKFGKESSYLVHAKMNDKEFFDRLESWEEKGGALLSIKRIGRGFRGTGTEAVFHTYQTSSSELYAQRTGRAWGKSASDQADLFVLEVAWNRRASFANLARLLGLIDYPGRQVNTRDIKPLLEEKKIREEAKSSLDEAIQQGRVSPVFIGVPMAESWRGIFKAVLERAGGVNALASCSGLSVEVLAGFALGALPLRASEILALADKLGGPENAKHLFVYAWQNIIQEVEGGKLRLHERLEEELFAWGEGANASQAGKSLDEVVSELDALLQRNLKYFPKGDSRQKLSARPVTEGDLALLREVHPKLDLTQLDDTQWRRIWLSLVGVAPEPIREKLLQHMFQREGWNFSPQTPKEKLLYRARREVALKFGGPLPIEIKIRGIANTPTNPVRRWLNGHPVVFNRKLTPHIFYRQLRSLLRELGLRSSHIDSLIAPAVFEERGWRWGRPANAREQLLQEARYWVAKHFGGQLPRYWNFSDNSTLDRREGKFSENPAEIRSLVTLDQWLRLGVRSNDFQGDPSAIYPLMTQLFSGLGVSARRYFPIVVEAVQEELSGLKQRTDLGEKARTSVESSLVEILLWLRGTHPGLSPRIQATSGSPSASEEVNVLEVALLREEIAGIKLDMAQLTTIESRILRWRFGLEGEEELGLKEIADKYSLSRQRISQLEERALGKLREKYDARDIAPPLQSMTEGHIEMILRLSHQEKPLAISEEIFPYIARAIVRYFGQHKTALHQEQAQALAHIVADCLSLGIGDVRHKYLPVVIATHISGKLDRIEFHQLARRFLDAYFERPVELKAKRPEAHAKKEGKPPRKRI